MAKSIDEVVINFNEGNLLIMNIALSIIMFGVALDISVNDFKQLFKQPKPLLIGLFSQFLMLPFLTFIMVVIIKPMPSIALGMMLVASCPGGNISNFMTSLSKGNSALSVSLTAISSFVAIIMTPFNFQFYGSLYKPTSEILNYIELDFFTLMKLVILILGLPLLLGLFINLKRNEIAKKISKTIKPFSIIFFILIVVIALFKNFDVFQEYIIDVLMIGIVHNLIAILLGFYLARFFRLSFLDQKTLAIETGIQNSGLGLFIDIFFF